jgi:transcriptional regulator GlxA family with amidase domain
VHAIAASAAFDDALVRATLYRSLAVSVFDAFRLRHDVRSRPLDARGGQQSYRMASRFIDDFASLPITLEDIARSAGLSTAQLDDVFRAFSPHGEGAWARLTRARLSAARDDLRAAIAVTEEAIQAIAIRWGFPTRQNFARLYEREYGHPLPRERP